MSSPAPTGRPEIEPLIEELSGRAAPVQRSPDRLAAAYRRVIEALIPAPTWPGVKGSPKRVLEEIVVRAGWPGAEARRSALARAILAYLEETGDRNARVFLLRQLALIAREEAVPALAARLADADPVVREYALRALQRNPSADAGRALLDALDEARRPDEQVAIINALGSRREEGAVGALAKRFAGREEKVATAAILAVGSIGTRDAAAALAAGGAGVAAGLRPHLARARLLCAGRLAKQGRRDAAHAIYKDLYAAAADGHLRMAALRGLVLTRPSEALPLVLAALRTGDARVQAQAARFVLHLPGREARQALLRVLPGLPPSAQGFLREALAERDGRRRRASARP